MIYKNQIINEIRGAIYDAKSEVLADIYKALFDEDAVYIGDDVWIIDPIPQLSKAHFNFLTDLVSLDYQTGLDVLKAWEKGRVGWTACDDLPTEYLKHDYPCLNGRFKNDKPSQEMREERRYMSEIVDEYMNENIFYGGFALPRWRALKDLEVQGGTKVSINHIMMGCKIILDDEMINYPLGIDAFDKLYPPYEQLYDLSMGEFAASFQMAFKSIFGVHPSFDGILQFKQEK